MNSTSHYYKRRLQILFYKDQISEFFQYPHYTHLQRFSSTISIHIPPHPPRIMSANKKNKNSKMENFGVSVKNYNNITPDREPWDGSRAIASGCFSKLFRCVLLVEEFNFCRLGKKNVITFYTSQLFNLRS